MNGMVNKKAIPRELFQACKLLDMRQEKGFIFTFKGHEIDLSECDGKLINVLNTIANQLADRLTEVHNGNIEALFGE